MASQKSVVVVPKDQWVIHKNMHKALVPKADYNLIYERKEQNQNSCHVKKSL